MLELLLVKTMDKKIKKNQLNKIMWKNNINSRKLLKISY